MHYYFLDPASIIHLNITHYSNTAVTLLWTLDNSSCAISNNYTIMYSIDGTGAHVHKQNITSQSYSYSLHNISHNVTYNISVAAIDAGGRTGPFSNSVCVLLSGK